VNPQLKRLTRLALMAALAVLLAGFVKYPLIPAYDFLKYDPADVVLMIAGFLYGPLWGLGLVLVTAVFQEMFFSTGAGWIGIIMHFCASGTLVVVSSCIYRYKKTRGFAILALVVGAVCRAGIMIPLNLLLTPIYTGWPRAAVAGVILPAILPFNAIKACINAIITFFVYKRVSRWMKADW